MGGEREDTIPAKKTAKGDILGTIRYHESGGEVHFHDDVAKLKVAMPVAIWFNLWQQVSTFSSKKSRKWYYVDTLNRTRLRLVCDHSSLEDCMQIELKISPVKISSAFEQLAKFVRR